MRYLPGTKALPIRYKGQLEDLQLICYSDADYASDAIAIRKVECSTSIQYSVPNYMNTVTIVVLFNGLNYSLY
jgi:hypothetical protein